jgi:hypothetical protein
MSFHICCNRNGCLDTLRKSVMCNGKVKRENKLMFDNIKVKL